MKSKSLKVLILCLAVLALVLAGCRSSSSSATATAGKEITTSVSFDVIKDATLFQSIIGGLKDAIVTNVMVEINKVPVGTAYIYDPVGGGLVVSYPTAGQPVRMGDIGTVWITYTPKAAGSYGLSITHYDTLGNAVGTDFFTLNVVGGPALTATPTSVTVGDSVAVSGQGFSGGAFAVVDLWDGSNRQWANICNAWVDSGGSFLIQSCVIPTGAGIGGGRLEAIDTNGVRSSAALTILAAPSGGAITFTYNGISLTNINRISCYFTNSRQVCTLGFTTGQSQVVADLTSFSFFADGDMNYKSPFVEHTVKAGNTVYVTVSGFNYEVSGGVADSSVASFGVSLAPSTVCGNGICEAGEDSINCPADCQAAPPTATMSITFDGLRRYDNIQKGGCSFVNLRSSCDFTTPGGVTNRQDGFTQVDLVSGTSVWRYTSPFITQDVRLGQSVTANVKAGQNYAVIGGVTDPATTTFNFDVVEAGGCTADGRCEAGTGVSCCVDKACSNDPDCVAIPPPTATMTVVCDSQTFAESTSISKSAGIDKTGRTVMFYDITEGGIRVNGQAIECTEAADTGAQLRVTADGDHIASSARNVRQQFDGNSIGVSVDGLSTTRRFQSVVVEAVGGAPPSQGSDAIISTNKRVYTIDKDSIFVTVMDQDEAGKGFVSATATTKNGDSEALTLTETATLGTFTNLIGLPVAQKTATVTQNNGQVEAEHWETIEIKYSDALSSDRKPFMRSKLVWPSETVRARMERLIGSGKYRASWTNTVFSPAKWVGAVFDAAGAIRVFGPADVLDRAVVDVQQSENSRDAVTGQWSGGMDDRARTDVDRCIETSPAGYTEPSSYVDMCAAECTAKGECGSGADLFTCLACESDCLAVKLSTTAKCVIAAKHGAATQVQPLP